MSGPPKYEAFREFVAGLDQFGRDYQASLDHLHRAQEIDPDFLSPALWELGALANLRQLSEAEALLDRLEPLRARLTPFEQRSLDSHRAGLEGRRMEALQAARDLHDMAPRASVLAYLHALGAYDAGLPGETLEVLASHGPPGDMGTSVEFFWDRLLLRALHALGRYDEEVARARAATATYPDVLTLRADLARGLVAAGRLDEAERAVDDALSVAPRAGFAPHVGTHGMVLATAAMALRTHGHADPARIMAERATVWFEQGQGKDQGPLERGLEYLNALALAGRWQACRTAATDLAAAAPLLGTASAADIIARGWQGVTAVHCGDAAAARSLAAELEAADRPHLHGEHLRQAARVHAERGDSTRALDLLRSAFADGLEWDLSLQQDLAFERLRDDPRFHELVGAKG
jgi:tetratricopeptide (TPR) repeat protein